MRGPPLARFSRGGWEARRSLLRRGRAGRPFAPVARAVLARRVGGSSQLAATREGGKALRSRRSRGSRAAGGRLVAACCDEGGRESPPLYGSPARDASHEARRT